METAQGRELGMLDLPAAQMKATKRLPNKMYKKRKHYAYKYKTENDDTIPFHKFCDWVMRQVKEGSNPYFEEDTPFNSKEAVKTFDKSRSNAGAPSQQYNQGNITYSSGVAKLRTMHMIGATMVELGSDLFEPAVG